VKVEGETQLVVRAAAGDREAFGLLAESVRPWVFGLCLRLTEDRRLAEDLTQEAFVQAFTHLAQLRDPARFRPWLSRIAVNACRMHLRAQSTRAEEVAEVEPPPAPAEEASALDVEEALARLEARNRRIVRLFYGEELSQAEIAETLSLSAAAVKSRLHRAREQLRREMLAMISEEQKAKLGVPEGQPWALRTVLLVVPEETIREPLRAGLEAAGYEVVVLPTGEAALESVEQRRGQMLVLDMECGTPHWLEVMLLLRVDEWSRDNMPIGLLAGVRGQENQRLKLLAWQAGAEFYLTKPAHVEELVSYVQRIGETWARR
jgi:RNA polymerase sigma factor (sigma-70 family)